VGRRGREQAGECEQAGNFDFTIRNFFDARFVAKRLKERPVGLCSHLELICAKRVVAGRWELTADRSFVN
jgi:hypothetical protein